MAVSLQALRETLYTEVQITICQPQIIFTFFPLNSSSGFGVECDVGAAQNTKWIQNSLTCLANVSGLVDYRHLQSWFIDRMEMPASPLGVLPGPQT